MCPSVLEFARNSRNAKNHSSLDSFVCEDLDERKLIGKAITISFVLIMLYLIKTTLCLELERLAEQYPHDNL